MNLPDGTWSIRARSEGYIESVKTVSVSGGAMTVADFTMNPALESGETLSFASIYFNSGSDVIQLISYGILDEVVSLLKDNSGVTVQVVGHTDSDGSSSMNQDLSLRRAQSVKNYLIQHGIAPDRLSTSGMGESSPIASNSTPQGKAENRRIDFVIL